MPYPATSHALFLLTLPCLTPGDIITYHGSTTEYRGKEFVVTDSSYQLVHLMQRDAQAMILENVRRVSVTPTGETVELCGGCGHITTETAGLLGACRRMGCRCMQHGPGPAPAMSKAAEHLLMAIVRLARSLHVGAALTTQDIQNGAIDHAGGQALVRAAAGPQLEVLVDLARAYMRDCPELGITEDRLAAALTGEAAALFATAPR